MIGMAQNELTSHGGVGARPPRALLMSPVPLNSQSFPGCVLARSHPLDVARVEHLTFICANDKDDAGPTNNWMDPGAAKYKVGALLDGAMRGRTMYVVPYIMGPVNSPISKTGVENQSQIKATVNAAVRANVSFYPVDARGLVALPPGGDASTASPRGTGLR